jgi:hypothetical protein
LAKNLGESAEARDASAEPLGRLEKVLVESDAVLIQSAEDLLQSPRDPCQSAEEVGDKDEVLILIATVLYR